MFKHKKIIKTTILMIIFSISVYSYWQYKTKNDPFLQAKTAIAAGGYPYIIGLTNVITINCFTTGTPPICTGGTLCATKDAATCLNYSDVSGTPAGGMGSNALFSNIAIAKAGLTSGGQLIAGGMSPVLMDNGILASAGGCAGCIANNNSENIFAKTVDSIKNFFVASSNNNQ